MRLRIGAGATLTVAIPVSRSPTRLVISEALPRLGLLRRIFRRLFQGTRGGQDARQAVVALVARVLEHLLVGLPHRQGHGPGLGPDRRVVDGVLIQKGIRVDAAEPLGEPQVLVWTVSKAAQTQRPGALAPEFLRLDDEGVTVPAAARLAFPLTDIRRKARPPVERNNPG